MWWWEIQKTVLLEQKKSLLNQSAEQLLAREKTWLTPPAIGILCASLTGQRCGANRGENREIGGVQYSSYLSEHYCTAPGIEGEVQASCLNLLPAIIGTVNVAPCFVPWLSTSLVGYLNSSSISLHNRQDSAQN